MKYRPSKRVIWLIIPLMPVLIMCAIVWLAGGSAETDISTRGSKPPPAQAVSKPMGWYDDGVYTMMESKLNPWRNQMSRQFASHFLTLKQSSDPQDQEKYRELMKLGKEWYERVLARYPELAITYKNLPPEQNGLLQWSLFEKRLRDAKKTGSSDLVDLPDEFTQHFGSSKDQKPWNPEAVKGWLDENRALLDEARAIALMPDQSSQGLSNNGWEMNWGTASDFAKAFLMEARLYAEAGDIDRALESIRTVNGLANHFRNGEAPTLIQGFVGTNLQRTADRYVLSKILPELPAGQTDVIKWEKALNPTLRQPEDFTRMIRGEWNTYMPGMLLPALADTNDPATPNDVEALAEVYTQSSGSLVTENESLHLRDLPSHPVTYPAYKHLSRRSQQIADDHGISGRYSPRDTWERAQVHTGLIQAAFTILKGQPVPNDPIHGLPYQWDPATRKLSLPDIPGYKKSGIKPLVLPEP